MKNDQDFISYLNRRSEEEEKHHITEKNLKDAHILGRDLKDKVFQSVAMGKLKFRFSPEIYDAETSTLKIFDVEIKIPHVTNQDYLCRVIFLKYEEILNDLEDEEREKAKRGIKEWSWDEIVVIMGHFKDQSNWRVVYNAARAVSDLVEKKTQAHDFFLTRPVKTVKINPKYLL